MIEDLIAEEKMELTEFDALMFAHVFEETGGNGCGDTDCVYCWTWVQHLRDGGGGE